jgi:hypothetical protein
LKDDLQPFWRSSPASRCNPALSSARLAGFGVTGVTSNRSLIMITKSPGCRRAVSAGTTLSQYQAFALDQGGSFGSSCTAAPQEDVAMTEPSPLSDNTAYISNSAALKELTRKRRVDAGFCVPRSVHVSASMCFPTLAEFLLALPSRAAAEGSASGMVNKTKPFHLISRQGHNTIHLRYGESSNDPRPFTLIVTPVYVAARINKGVPSNEDVIAYVETHAEELRTIAISKYERGFSTETLL